MPGTKHAPLSHRTYCSDPTHDSTTCSVDVVLAVVDGVDVVDVVDDVVGVVVVVVDVVMAMHAPDMQVPVPLTPVHALPSPRTGPRKHVCVKHIPFCRHTPEAHAAPLPTPAHDISAVLVVAAAVVIDVELVELPSCDEVDAVVVVLCMIVDDDDDMQYPAEHVPVLPPSVHVVPSINTAPAKQADSKHTPATKHGPASHRCPVEPAVHTSSTSNVDDVVVDVVKGTQMRSDVIVAGASSYSSFVHTVSPAQ